MALAKWHVQQEAALKRSADIHEVLDRLGVDPAEHLASLLLPDSEADEKRKDDAAKQLLPYCYPRKATPAVSDKEGTLIAVVESARLPG